MNRKDDIKRLTDELKQNIAMLETLEEENKLLKEQLGKR